MAGYSGSDHLSLASVAVSEDCQVVDSDYYLSLASAAVAEDY